MFSLHLARPRAYMGSLEESPVKNFSRSEFAEVISDSRVAAACGLVSKLDAQELQFLRIITAGGSAQAASRVLGLNSSAAENLRRQMMTKLDAPTTCDAVRVALYAGLGR